LAIDTLSLPKRPNYGFEFLQTGGNAVSITNVSMIDSSTKVLITLDSIPTGTDQKLRYAYTCYHGGTGFAACGDGQDPTAVGGNIRDTDSRTSPADSSTGLPLFDWSVTFEEPVIFIPVAVNAAMQPKLEVFPNPVHSFVNVAWGEGGPGIQRVLLRDLQGKVIQTWENEKSESSLTLDLGNVPSGFYFLEAISEVGTLAWHKIVVE
jgi:hypothetical protein